MSRIDAGDTRRIALVSLATLVALAAVAVPAVGAPPATEDTTFVVALSEDGSATVTLELTFDLDREEERQALARLRANRTAIAAGFGEQLQAVAARTAAETGREMRVTDATVEVSTAGSTGHVALSATWTGLARVEGDRLVVSEPFADGFQPPGAFVLRGPEGYELAASVPSASTTAEAEASWQAGSSLDGFEAAFVPASSSPSQSLPGFGFPAGIIAVALVAALSVALARRRS